MRSDPCDPALFIIRHCDWPTTGCLTVLFYITTTVPSNALYCNETCHSNATPPTALPRTCNALHFLLKVDSLKEPGKHMGTVAECAVPTRFHITSGTFTATRYFLGLSQAVLWSVWTLPNFKRFYVHNRASFFIQFHCDSIPVQQLEGEATP